MAIKNWWENIEIATVGEGRDKSFAVVDVGHKDRVFAAAGFRDKETAVAYREALVSGQTTELLRLGTKSMWVDKFLKHEDVRIVETR